MANENGKVVLKTKGAKSKKQEFGVEHANKVLSLPNTQWALEDKGYKWNGKELAKK